MRHALISHQLIFMRPVVLHSLCLFVFLTCFPGFLWTHQDTLIELNSGRLVGLPKEFEPAELNLKSFEIRIKNRSMALSPFLKSLFPEKQPYDLTITSSWYHDSSILPPYICLKIHPQGKDFSYEILLNMDTLDIIKVTVVLQEDKWTTRYLEIELSEVRRQEIRKSIKVIQEESRPQGVE